MPVFASAKGKKANMKYVCRTSNLIYETYQI